MSRLGANVIIICLLEFMENNVGKVWIIGAIDGFGRKLLASGSIVYCWNCFEYFVDCLECFYIVCKRLRISNAYVSIGI